MGWFVCVCSVPLYIVMQEREREDGDICKNEAEDGDVQLRSSVGF